jgi:ATP-dependent Clp protease adaptor protein ClpS
MADTAVKSRELVTTSLKPPSKYKVLVMNDDVTPMEFVVAMLMTVFKHNEGTAIDLTMKIHNEGSAVAGVYTYEVAEQKCIDATYLAREHGHPLVVKAEEE